MRGRLGRKELKKSLHTSDRQAALAAAKQLVAAVEQYYIRVRCGMLTERQNNLQLHCWLSLPERLKIVEKLTEVQLIHS